MSTSSIQFSATVQQKPQENGSLHEANPTANQATNPAANQAPSDQAVVAIASRALQSNADKPQILARPVSSPATIELVNRIKPLIQAWQENQNRRSVVQQMDSILTPLISEQRSDIDQLLTHTQGATAAMSEIQAMHLLQNTLVAAIDAYGPWRLQGSVEDLLPKVIIDWMFAATPERVALLPDAFQVRLQHSAWGSNMMLPLLNLETAYKNQDFRAIITLQGWCSGKSGQNWIARRKGAVEQVATGFEYFTRCTNRLANRDALYAERYTLSGKERKDLLLVYHDMYRKGESASHLRSFLELRNALENNDITSMRCNYDGLSSEDKRFFENQYSIPVGKWVEFWGLYEYFVELQEKCALSAHPDSRETGETSPALHIRNTFHECKKLAKEMSEGYAILSDAVWQYASSALRTVITDVNRAIAHELNRESLEAQLDAGENLQNFSPEQQNQHIARCHDLIQRIETNPQGKVTSTILAAMLPRYMIETKLRTYKMTTERLRGPLTDTERMQTIWDLAKIETSVLAHHFAKIKTHLGTLYPSLLAPLHAITYELQYAKLLIWANQDRNSGMYPSTILTLHNIATHCDANHCDALLTQFREHLPNFNTLIPNVSELYPILRTDMGALRQIHHLQSTPLTLAERTATVQSITAYRGNMAPDHFSGVIRTLSIIVCTNSAAKNLLKAIYEANLELACRGLASQDSAERNRSIIEMGQALAETASIPLSIRHEFLEYLKTAYPAFREHEGQVLCVQVYAQYLKQQEANKEPHAEFILQLDTLMTQMTLEQCEELVQELYPTRPLNLTLRGFMSDVSSIQRFAALAATPEDATRTRILQEDIQCDWILDQREALAASPEGRDLLRKVFAYRLERLCDSYAKSYKILFKIGDLLAKNYELHMMLRDMHVIDNQIIDDLTVTTLAERATSKGTLQCVAFLTLLQKYKEEKQEASPEEYIQLQTREREVFQALNSTATLIGKEDFNTFMLDLQTHRPDMRDLITALRTEEFAYNMDYRLSVDHYERVRFDDVIPPLPASIIDQDGAFRDGLINFFTALPLAELQAQLTTPRENARETLSTYINNVITHAPISGAPNPINQPEEARAFWGKIKQTIVHILIYLNDAEQKATELPHNTEEAKQVRDKALTNLKKKKIQFLATLIDSVGHCGGRYKADAVDLYQQIVTNRPVSFETVIFRELNNMREANARVLSLTGVENAGDEPHEFMGFLRLVGHALAIRGTPKAEERFDDIYFAGTRINREYANNTQRLRQRFEKMYTPFNIITCIQQEVGPGANVDNRNLFRDWCLTNVPVSVYWGGASGSRDLSDWGMYHDDITSIDTARQQLRDQRSRAAEPSVQRAVLQRHGIPIVANQGIDAAIDAHEAKIKKEAYIAREAYEAYPNDMRVKQAFIAKILVQMGLFSSTASS